MSRAGRIGPRPNDYEALAAVRATARLPTVRGRRRPRHWAKAVSRGCLPSRVLGGEREATAQGRRARTGSPRRATPASSSQHSPSVAAATPIGSTEVSAGSSAALAACSPANGRHDMRLDAFAISPSPPRQPASAGWPGSRTRSPPRRRDASEARRNLASPRLFGDLGVVLRLHS